MSIYFVQCGTNGPIKIGYTNNDVQERISQLQVACPYDLKVLWVYDGEGYTENDIHKLFKHENIRGEWFRPSRDIFSFISCELTNYYAIKTNNGRSLLLCESYEGGDEISIGHKKYGESFLSGSYLGHTIFHNFEADRIDIDPANQSVIVRASNDPR